MRETKEAQKLILSLKKSGQTKEQIFDYFKKDKLFSNLGDMVLKGFVNRGFEERNINKPIKFIESKGIANLKML